MATAGPISFPADSGACWRHVRARIIYVSIGGSLDHARSPITPTFPCCSGQPDQSTLYAISLPVPVHIHLAMLQRLSYERWIRTCFLVPRQGLFGYREALRLKSSYSVVTPSRNGKSSFATTLRYVGPQAGLSLPSARVADATSQSRFSALRVMTLSLRASMARSAIRPTPTDPMMIGNIVYLTESNDGVLPSHIPLCGLKKAPGES